MNDTFNNDEVVCPHCFAEQENDGWEDGYTYQCNDCELHFNLTVEAEYRYTTEKEDE